MHWRKRKLLCLWEIILFASLVSFYLKIYVDNLCVFIVRLALQHLGWEIGGIMVELGSRFLVNQELKRFRMLFWESWRGILEIGGCVVLKTFIFQISQLFYLTSTVSQR
jgi:hypothetical protein